MATDTRKPAQPAAEAHILFEAYACLAILASLVSVILPHIRKVNREYKEGRYVYTLDKDAPGLTLIHADQWAAIQVASRLAGKDTP